jgi:hypothetical protein
MPNRAVLARVLPFALYVLFLVVEDVAPRLVGPEFDVRWLYPVKVGLVGLLLIALFARYPELHRLPERRVWLWLGAPLVGAMVFVLWINLDFGWLNLGSGAGGFDPRTPTGEFDWSLILSRIAGAAIVVPVMEELFWRSFLMRWVDKVDFLAVPPAAVSLRAIVLSSIVFALAHPLWFAGLLAGLAYASLYRASGNLWPPVAAHAVTNLMLGVWVVQTGQWQFW